jgi:excisionase family DNA binding protein
MRTISSAEQRRRDRQRNQPRAPQPGTGHNGGPAFNEDLRLRITSTIAEFNRLTGVGNTKTYQLLNDDEIESITVGRRRLIVLASWHAYVERHRGKPSTAPVVAPPPRPARRRAAAAA